MILVADSGSTKTDWRAFSLDNSVQLQGQSEGLNPYFSNAEKVAAEAAKAIDKAYYDKIKEVHFYGSGCSADHGKRIIKEGLQMVFPSARFFVEHDLLASARALCGKEAGVACILGTGANACYYNGNTIVSEAVSFGYVMGDEGAGSHLGKLFLKDLLNHRLSETVSQAFYERYPSFDLEYLLHRLYRTSNPNKYLSSFSPFISEYQKDESVKYLLKRAFNAFVDEFVVDLSKADVQTLPIHFQGSIAWHFRDILQEVLQDQQLICGRILGYPIDALLQYHKDNVLIR